LTQGFDIRGEALYFRLRGRIAEAAAERADDGWIVRRAADGVGELLGGDFAGIALRALRTGGKCEGAGGVVVGLVHRQRAVAVVADVADAAAIGAVGSCRAAGDRRSGASTTGGHRR
jgi:hypothetical protein